jgi:hypothetical protein
MLYLKVETGLELTTLCSSGWPLLAGVAGQLRSSTLVSAGGGAPVQAQTTC